ncbi:MAG: CRISPR-associated protein Csm7 [Methylomonas sp.]|jgi:CRISPR-associated protein Csm4
MQSYCVTLAPLSAFATPLKGDTLFGQLCWAVRNRFGENRLMQLLDGYTAHSPYAVVSDAFPEGYLPLPKLPGHYYSAIPGMDRKAVKKRCWLPETAVQKPLKDWLSAAKTSFEVSGNPCGISEMHTQPHNTINRLTNTTGGDGFSPYSIEQDWFAPNVRYAFFLLLDSDRLSAVDCLQCLTDIGNLGFGRDASIGLGKYTITAFDEKTLRAQTTANACMTLAPCAPQGLGFTSQYSFYQLFTRFGRHGDLAVHQAGKPFKNPVLMAQTAAIFSVQPPATGFIGQGVGGNGQLSNTLAATVQQGYAPVIPVSADFAKE